MVTGHRDVRHRGLVLERCRQVLERLAPERAVTGGAAGADSLFARAALDVGVPVVVFLPNRWYRSRYPGSVSDEVLAAAADVVVVVDRPVTADWAQRWHSERWWVDNFARNAAMVDASDVAVVVSSRHPRDLAGASKGGTAACVRDLGRTRPHDRVVWVPDDPAAYVRWARVTPGVADGRRGSRTVRS
jgi:hypothetical protein